MTDYDSPWKDLLNDYFQDFMAFFFPAACADIDWSRGYESLDKELSQIVRDAELGKRLADKVVKVGLPGRHPLSHRQAVRLSRARGRTGAERQYFRHGGDGPSAKPVDPP